MSDTAYPPNDTTASKNASVRRDNLPNPVSAMVRDAHIDSRNAVSRDQPPNAQDQLGTSGSRTVGLGKTTSGGVLSDKMGPSLTNTGGNRNPGQM